MQRSAPRPKRVPRGRLRPSAAAKRPSASWTRRGRCPKPTLAVETELADARAVAARTQEFYETERGEREAAERNVRALRDQIRTMEQDLEEFEGGGFTDVCGLFSGVSGGVAARARGTALREAKQELERRRAELAVVAVSYTHLTLPTILLV